MLSGGIDATPVTLVPPGASWTIAHDINNLGQIVGEYLDAGGSPRSFVATPIPEPATLLLAATGALAMLGLRYHVSPGSENLRSSYLPSQKSGR